MKYLVRPQVEIVTGKACNCYQAGYVDCCLAGVNACSPVCNPNVFPQCPRRCYRSVPYIVGTKNG